MNIVHLLTRVRKCPKDEGDAFTINESKNDDALSVQIAGLYCVPRVKYGVFGLLSEVHLVNNPNTIRVQFMRTRKCGVSVF